MFDIWRCQSELADKIYALNNYKVEYCHDYKNPLIGEKICVIYCSSNNIWSPNQEDAFRRSFVDNDYYEWTSIRKNDAHKEIWIRDIYKSWYVTGINEREKSIDHIIEFLKKETVGYVVWTIGSSAGGYMAALIAHELHAKAAICFSAQFDLRQKGAIDRNPFLQKYEGTSRSKYYDLSQIIRSENTEIFYFYPKKNEQDCRHYKKIVQCPGVHSAGIGSKRHGVVFLKCCLPTVLNMDIESLRKLAFLIQKKGYTPLKLSLKLVGSKVTLKFIFKEVVKFLKK